MSQVKYSLCGSGACKAAIEIYPDYRVFWRSGFAYRGAQEHEVSKVTEETPCYPYWDANGKWHNTRVMTFEEKMEANYNWAAAMNMTVDHDAKEIHINGFSVNDME